MRIEDISHNHLLDYIRVFDGADFEELDQFYGLYLPEMEYSTFIAPTFKVEDNDFLFLMHRDGEEFIPLFTDLNEYNKVFGNDRNLTPMFYDFDYYLSAHKQLVINPGSISFFIDLMEFCGKPETPVLPKNITRETYEVRFLRMFVDKFRNNSLNSYLKDPKGIYDYDEFFKKFANSILFTTAYIESDEEIVNLEGKPYNLTATPEGYLELYSSTDRIAGDDNIFVQVVNLTNFIEKIIRTDMNGAVLYLDNCKIILNREILLLNFEYLKEIYPDERYALAEDWAFKV